MQPARRPQAIGPFFCAARLAFVRWPHWRADAAIAAVRHRRRARRSDMNKRFVVAWLVLFVVWMVKDMVVHGMLLNADYKGLPQLFRSEADAQAYFGWMILAHVLLAGALVWIYERGI